MIGVLTTIPARPAPYGLEGLCVGIFVIKLFTLALVSFRILFGQHTFLSELIASPGPRTSLSLLSQVLFFGFIL